MLEGNISIMQIYLDVIKPNRILLRDELKLISLFTEQSVCLKIQLNIL